jgi:hypothetical protein
MTLTTKSTPKTEILKILSEHGAALGIEPSIEGLNTLLTEGAYHPGDLTEVADDSDIWEVVLDALKTCLPVRLHPNKFRPFTVEKLNRGFTNRVLKDTNARYKPEYLNLKKVPLAETIDVCGKPIFRWAYEDWKRSGISDEMIALNVISVAGVEAKRFLHIKEINGSDNLYCDGAAAVLKGAWVVQDDPEAPDSDPSAYTAKPENPRFVTDKAGEYELDSQGNRKVAKYEYKPKKNGKNGIKITPECPPVLFRITDEVRRKLHRVSGVPLEGNYWQALRSNRHIPIVICEGVKKAIALTEMGFPAIAVRSTTVWGIYVDRKYDEKGYLLQETFERFRGILDKLAVEERPVCIAFDSDEKPNSRKAVFGQAEKLFQVLEQRGCEVSLRTWPTSYGKGVDDVIAGLDSDPAAFRTWWDTNCELHTTVVAVARLANGAKSEAAIAKRAPKAAKSGGKPSPIERLLEESPMFEEFLDYDKAIAEAQGFGRTQVGIQKGDKANLKEYIIQRGYPYEGFAASLPESLSLVGATHANKVLKGNEAGKPWTENAALPVGAPRLCYPREGLSTDRLLTEVAVRLRSVEAMFKADGQPYEGNPEVNLNEWADVYRATYPKATTEAGIAIGDMDLTDFRDWLEDIWLEADTEDLIEPSKKDHAKLSRTWTYERVAEQIAKKIERAVVGHSKAVRSAIASQDETEIGACYDAHEKAMIALRGDVTGPFANTKGGLSTAKKPPRGPIIYTDAAPFDFTIEKILSFGYRTDENLDAIEISISTVHGVDGTPSAPQTIILDRNWSAGVKEFNAALGRSRWTHSMLKFNGTGVQLHALINNKLLAFRAKYGETRNYRLVEFSGWQPDEKVWVFPSQQFSEQGELLTPEETGLVFNEHLTNNSDVKAMPVKIDTSHDPEAVLRDWARLRSQSADAAGMATTCLTLGWVAANMHRDKILDQLGGFASFNLTGETNAGKTQDGLDAAAIFGLGTENILTIVSASACAQHLCLNSGIPVILDDVQKGKRSGNFQDSLDLDSILQSVYNGQGQSKRGVDQLPHTNLLVLGNRKSGEQNPAVQSRLCGVHRAKFVSKSRTDDPHWLTNMRAVRKKMSCLFPVFAGWGFDEEVIRAVGDRQLELSQIFRRDDSSHRVLQSFALVEHYALKVAKLAGIPAESIRTEVGRQIGGTLTDSQYGSGGLFLSALLGELQASRLNRSVAYTATIDTRAKYFAGEDALYLRTAHVFNAFRQLPAYRDMSATVELGTVKGILMGELRDYIQQRYPGADDAKIAGYLERTMGRFYPDTATAIQAEGIARAAELSGSGGEVTDKLLRRTGAIVLPFSLIEQITGETLEREVPAVLLEEETVEAPVEEPKPAPKVAPKAAKAPRKALRPAKAEPERLIQKLPPDQLEVLDRQLESCKDDDDYGALWHEVQERHCGKVEAAAKSLMRQMRDNPKRTATEAKLEGFWKVMQGDLIDWKGRKLMPE